MTRPGDILGYARLSTVDQDLSGQVMRLNEAVPFACLRMLCLANISTAPVYLP